MVEEAEVAPVVVVAEAVAARVVAGEAEVEAVEQRTR